MKHRTVLYGFILWLISIFVGFLCLYINQFFQFNLFVELKHISPAPLVSVIIYLVWYVFILLDKKLIPRLLETKDTKTLISTKIVTTIAIFDLAFWVALFGPAGFVFFFSVTGFLGYALVFWRVSKRL